MSEQFSPANPLVIDCCGDSTMAGWANTGTKGNPHQTAPNDGGFVATPGPQGLLALLQGRFGQTVKVNNLGKSGTTCTNWRDGTAGVPTPWAEYVKATPASVIVLGLGINDTLAELTSIYPALADEATIAGKRFVIQTPNVLDFAGDVMAPKVSFEQQLADSRDLPLIDFNDATTTMGAAWFADLSYAMAGTEWVGVHPNQAGYTLMAAVMDTTVSPIVADLLGAPKGRLATANPLPGVLLLGWDTPGITVVNVLPPKGPGFWNGQGGVQGVNYGVGGPKGARAVFSLPAGQYRVELAAIFAGGWLALDVVTVDVS